MKKLPDQTPVPAVGVICFKGKRVILIKRSKPPKAGDWSLPGGRIEPGETRREAALRELYEETGVRARIIEKIAEIDADFGSHHFILHDYLAIWEHGEIIAGDDAADARLYDMADIVALNMWPKTEGVIRDAFTRLNDKAG